MDDTEQRAAGFLAYKGYQENEFVYEPDGNVPPDFVLQNKIAIEVRRLNQNFEHKNITEGLEETAIPLSDTMKKLVESFGPPTGEHSWFVFYKFGRPKIPWNKVVPELTQFLSDFTNNTTTMTWKYKSGKSLAIEIVPSSLKFGTFFVIGAYVDRQSGGFVVAEMIRNIKICVVDKSRKVAAHKDKYDEWWLILVDKISRGTLDNDDIALIRRHKPDIRDWNKIIIIDPTGYSRSFEL